MRTDERIETIKTKVYIAFDNTEFKDFESCLIHELRQNSKKSGNVVYVVKYKQTGRGIEIFSTRELAMKSLEKCVNIEQWEIEEIIIDFRFLLRNINE